VTTKTGRASTSTSAKNIFFPRGRKNAIASAFLWMSGQMFHRFLFTQGDFS
jgi:hypothetical protein